VGARSAWQGEAPPEPGLAASLSLEIHRSIYRSTRSRSRGITWARQAVRDNALEGLQDSAQRFNPGTPKIKGSP
jgi:hypothetical protein